MDGTRKQFMETLTTVPLLIIDDFGMRKLPLTAAEDLLEIVMRRYESASTLLTSNRPVEDWGKLLGDVAAVTAMLDRILHHGHVLKCGPRSWRTKMAAAAEARSDGGPGGLDSFRSQISSGTDQEKQKPFERKESKPATVEVLTASRWSAPGSLPRAPRTR